MDKRYIQTTLGNAIIDADKPTWIWTGTQESPIEDRVEKFIKNYARDLSAGSMIAYSPSAICTELSDIKPHLRNNYRYRYAADQLFVLNDKNEEVNRLRVELMKALLPYLGLDFTRYESAVLNQGGELPRGTLSRMSEIIYETLQEENVMVGRSTPHNWLTTTIAPQERKVLAALGKHAEKIPGFAYFSSQDKDLVDLYFNHRLLTELHRRIQLLLNKCNIVEVMESRKKMTEGRDPFYVMLDQLTEDVMKDFMYVVGPKVALARIIDVSKIRKSKEEKYIRNKDNKIRDGIVIDDIIGSGMVSGVNIKRKVIPLPQASTDYGVLHQVLKETLTNYIEKNELMEKHDSAYSFIGKSPRDLVGIIGLRMSVVNNLSSDVLNALDPDMQGSRMETYFDDAFFGDVLRRTYSKIVDHVVTKIHDGGIDEFFNFDLGTIGGFISEYCRVSKAMPPEIDQIERLNTQGLQDNEKITIIGTQNQTNAILASAVGRPYISHDPTFYVQRRAQRDNYVKKLAQQLYTKYGLQISLDGEEEPNQSVLPIEIIRSIQLDAVTKGDLSVLLMKNEELQKQPFFEKILESGRILSRQETANILERYNLAHFLQFIDIGMK